MKSKSKVPAAIVLAVGVVAAVVAVIVALIPMGKSGAAEPTAAFRAQASLDEVMFKLLNAPAVKYTGKFDYQTGQGTSGAVEFTDLTATASNSVQGTVRIAGQQGEYRQLGNVEYLSAPVALWNSLLSDNQRNSLDTTPLNNKWASPTYTSLPSIGVQLSSNNVAGNVLNTERSLPADQQPELPASLELPAPNKGLPDARFWPTSDPPVTFVGDNVVRVGDAEVTFNPETKDVTHIKNKYKWFSYTITLDTDVTLLKSEQAKTLFANQEAILNDLVSVPAPGLVPSGGVNSAVRLNAAGCDGLRCTWNVTANGAQTATGSSTAGHFNFGLTATYTLNGRPIPGTCNLVLRADFGTVARNRCVVSVPGAGTVRIMPTNTYLGFLDQSAEELRKYLTETEERTNSRNEFVRTGYKKLDAALYGSINVNVLPSFIAIDKGGYLFDGVSPRGSLTITFANGYASHVTGGRFDPNWPGTDTLKRQLGEQVKAANGTKVIYFAAERDTATALQAMVRDVYPSTEEDKSPVLVGYQPPSAS
ncbi:hypothetical protein QSJ18_14580 [Gordonia sp. ABSL1-1]|uniref:hypothetical protein n=1 Tax=Gordonia sp. ABSL1-1 TaxID=3053923 RepID=UPI0025724291|nr:hypothetical protein [Gordonia sp. ABSL1-1]MDL9937977.1 hypothetical protein [Gordonia sp. ABSL1-1]